MPHGGTGGTRAARPEEGTYQPTGDTMNATTYHALSEGLRELDRSLTAARYGQGRHGTVPPEEIATTVEEVAAEAASLRRFLRASEKEAAA